MSLNNIIVFKSNHNGISIKLDSSCDFDELKEAFSKKVIEYKKFLGTTETAVSFTGRVLSDDEQNQLIEIISKESDLIISIVGDIRKIKKVEVDKDIIIPEVDKTNIEFARENETYYHYGAIRSGQAITYSGSVVVVGDVNSGAEVTAQGNIIILGTLKGLCHAGCSGNDNCFISALNFIPMQVRISSHIVTMPEKPKSKVRRIRNNKDKTPELCIPLYAFIENNQISIIPLT